MIRKRNKQKLHLRKNKGCSNSQNRCPTIFCSKFHSFEELEESSAVYYSSLTPQQRLDTLQYLRDQYYKLKGLKPQGINKKVCNFGNILNN